MRILLLKKILVLDFFFFRREYKIKLILLIVSFNKRICRRVFLVLSINKIKWKILNLIGRNLGNIATITNYFLNILRNLNVHS